MVYRNRAAIALLDALYLPLHISGVSFRMIGYGMPKVCYVSPIYNLDLCFILGMKRLQIMLTTGPISTSHINNKFLIWV